MEEIFLAATKTFVVHFLDFTYIWLQYAEREGGGGESEFDRCCLCSQRTRAKIIAGVELITC